MHCNVYLCISTYISVRVTRETRSISNLESVIVSLALTTLRWRARKSREKSIVWIIRAERKIVVLTKKIKRSIL